MSIGQLRNQMVGEPTRVPGFAEGYGQAPGQARPSMPPQPNPIGRPSLVVGGPAYYTPPGFQAPPQPTEAFLPTDRRPDPIGQQFMRQLESPMGQQFQQQYEATQAPLRQAERERQEAELARRDERFQELMDRIAQLEGQLGAQEEAPVMPNIPRFPIGDDGNFQIDFSKIPNFGNFLNFNPFNNQIKKKRGNILTRAIEKLNAKQMEPVEREDYQDLMSEINQNIDFGTDFSKRRGSGGFRPGGDGRLIPKSQAVYAGGTPNFNMEPQPKDPQKRISLEDAFTKLEEQIRNQSPPQTQMQRVDMPSIPKITTPVIPPMPPIPKFEVPVNLPKINIPNIPKPNIPSIPKFDAPIGAPSIFGFGPTP